MYAIVTLVMKGNYYIPGAIALANSLRIYSKAELVCMITSDVTESDKLEKVFDKVIVVDYIQAKDTKLMTEKQSKKYAEWINQSPTKWNILGLDMYEKVLFMDSDMIAISPIDELFTYNTPAIMFDFPYEKKYREDRRHIEFSEVYLRKDEKFQSKMVNDVWNSPKPGEMIERSLIESINTEYVKPLYTPSGGIILVEPSKFALNLYKLQLPEIVDMKIKHDEIVSSTQKNKNTVFISGIDEYSILMFYHINGYNWYHIPMKYNVSVTQVYPIFESDAKVLHFISYKPWCEKCREECIQDVINYHKNKKKLNNINISYIEKAYGTWWDMYKNTYSTLKLSIAGPTRLTSTNSPDELIRRLIDIFVPIYGKEQVDKVMKKHSNLFVQAFTTKEFDPVFNYELLEAFGDKFLAGQFIWLLVDTPGIISPEQVTLISSYYQDRYRLEELCMKLQLNKYIRYGKAQKLSTKIYSDVIESLIAAIALAWNSTYGDIDGNTAIYKFVSTQWKLLPPIDPINYNEKYQEPKTALKQILEQFGRANEIDSGTKLIKDYNNVFVTFEYGGKIIGKGQSPIFGMNKEKARKEAEKEAYTQALESLEIMDLKQKISAMKNL